MQRRVNIYIFIAIFENAFLTNFVLSIRRILMNGLIGAPTIRQYYSYVTDPCCKRVGTQLWVFIMIVFRYGQWT